MKSWLSENRHLVVYYAVVGTFLGIFTWMTVDYHRQTDKALGSGVQPCRCVCGKP